MAEKMLPVNGEKLRELLIENCGNLTEAGRRVGKSGKFYGNFIRLGRIPGYAMLLTDSILGIPYDEYKLEEPRMEVTEDGCEWCRVYKQAVAEPWRTIKYCPKCGVLL